MKAFLILFCVLIGTIVCKPTKEKLERVSYKGHKLISVTAKTPLEVEYLRELQNDLDMHLDFWKQPMKGDVHIHVDPTVEKSLLKSLKRAGLQYSIVQEDIQSLIDSELTSIARNAGPRNYESSYLNLEQIDQMLSDLQATYPERVQRFNLEGTTHEGNSIWGVKVSTNLNGSGKKAVWIEAGTHAREFVVISVALATIDKLASLYGGNGAEAEKVTEMLDLYDWYFAPVHNPDGYDHAYYQERLWRKNRRGNGNCRGTDLNRNWNANWGGEGSSGQTCSDTYRGPSALSEVETTALNNAVINTENVVAFISLHCYSQYILLPWGYTNSKPSDYNTLLRIAQSAEAELESYYRTRFIVGTPPDILYVASGGAYDHMKLNNGIKYTYTYELRPSSGSTNGFVLPTSEIAPTITETFASLWKFAVEIHADDTATNGK